MTIGNSLVRTLRTFGDNPSQHDRGSGWNINRRSPSGPAVTEESSLQITTVYRCVQLIASTAGGQPQHVYDESGGSKALQISTDDTKYLWLRPNLEMTRITFWETVIGHEVMGDAFIWVDKDDLGGVAAIWYIEPERVRVGRLRDAVGQVPAGTKIYEIDRELPMIDYRSGGEIVHVPNWSRNSLRGVSPIAVATTAIGLGISAEEYAARFFSQDSTPHGLLTSEQVLTDEQADRLAARWERRNSGLANAHRTAVLGAGSKFQAISINPMESQLIEERRFQVAEIARLFGVPPHMVGDIERSTSWGTGIEEMTLGFVQYTLAAHILRFEQAINDALLVRELTKRYVKFDLDGLLRGTTLKRYMAHQVSLNWKTRNEVRADEDLPPIDGGDELLAMTNLVPIDQLIAADNATNPPPAASGTAGPGDAP